MFKNWVAICGIEESHMMWAIATLKIESEMGKRFVEAFPEYFSEKDETGPYPLSLILEKAQKSGALPFFTNLYESIFILYIFNKTILIPN